MRQVVTTTPSATAACEVQVWVLPVVRDNSVFHSGDMQCVSLRVNRVMYLDARNVAPPHLQHVIVEKAKAMLPRSLPQAGGVYRVDILEARFRAKDKDTFGALTDTRSVDAVFGTKSLFEHGPFWMLGCFAH